MMSIHKANTSTNSVEIQIQSPTSDSPTTQTNDNLSVRVVVRVRPFFNEDLKKPGSKSSDTSVIEVNSEVGTMYIPPLSLRYFYDQVLGEESTQQDMFNVVESLIPKLVEGFNVTILAYGQTSSGKTYTMGTGVLRNDDTDGIIPRAVHEIFTQVESLKEESQVGLTVSYLEIYNEEFIDLLIPDHYGPNYKPDIQIREDGKGNIVWTGVTELDVETVEDVMRLLLSGTAKRQIAETAMNSVSSRSHAIFSLGLKSVYKSETGSKIVTQSKFHFVDLAGSERMKKTGASGSRAKEGININGGLLALGNVISALGKVPKMPHIPYRDSKLTRLLQDSIGGNSYTIMIACVSPAPVDLSETQNTLLYANRAKKIKNRATKNHTEIDDINSLKQQLQELKLELESYKKPGVPTTNRLNSPAPSTPSDPRAMQFLFERVEILETDLRQTRGKFSELRKRYTHLVQNYNRKADEVSFMQFDTMSNAPTEMSFMSDIQFSSNNEVIKYEQLIQNLEEQLRQIREDRFDLESKLNSETNAKSQLLAQNDLNLSELFKLQQQLDILENDKKNLESRLSSNPSFVPVPDFDISSIHESQSGESKIEQIEVEMSQLQIQNQELQDLNNQLKEELSQLQKSPTQALPSPLPSHVSNRNFDSDATSIDSFEQNSVVEYEPAPLSIITNLEKRETEHLALIEQLRVQVLQLQNEKHDLVHQLHSDSSNLNSTETSKSVDEVPVTPNDTPNGNSNDDTISHEVINAETINTEMINTETISPETNGELSSEKLANPTNESTLNEISDTKDRGLPNGNVTKSMSPKKSVNAEFIQLQQKLKEYEALLDEKNKLIDTFHNNNEEKSDAIRKYKTRLTKQDSTIGLHHQQVNDLQSQMDNLNSQLQNEKLINTNYQDQITKLTQNITSLESSLKEASESQPTESIDDLKNEIEQFKLVISKYETQISDQHELISAYQDQINELENLLEQSKNDRIKYQSQADEFKTRSVNLRSELDQMSISLDQSQSNIEPLNILVLELERHNDSLGNQYREVNNKLNHRDSELRDKKEKIEELTNNLNHVNASYRALKKEFDQFQSLAQDVETQLVETQADVAELTLLHADSEALLTQKDHEIQKLKSEVKKAASITSGSPRDGSFASPTFSEANSELTSRVSSLESAISQYKNQISLLQSSSDQKDQALNNLHLINEGLESERRENLVKHQEQLEELRQSVNRYCAELATEREAHQKTQSQYQMIESRLEVIQEERAMAQHAGSRKSRFLCF